MAGYIELHDEEPIGAARIAMLQQEAFEHRLAQLKHLISLENKVADARDRQKKLVALGYTGRQDSDPEFPNFTRSDFG